MKLLSIGFLIFFIIQTDGFSQTGSNPVSDDIYFKNVVYGTLGAIPNVAKKFIYERKLTNPVIDRTSLQR